MKRHKLLTGIICLSLCALSAGCANQALPPAESSTGPEISSTNSIDVSSMDSSSSSAQTSNVEIKNKEIVLYAYNGPISSPADHKLLAELPKDTKEIKETVTVPVDEATPDGIMKLYVDKYLTAPVANGSMTFSYSKVTLSGDGIITIDFTKNGARYLSYGTMLESDTLYGIGKTMLMNVDGAKAVCYGIEGGNYSTEMSLDRNSPYLTK